jgi:glycosyltransferase involved in cell wall biosynthesis
MSYHIDKNVNIAFIMPSFRGGGAERVFIDLAVKFYQEGHKVELIALSADGEYRSQVPDDLPIQILNHNKVILSIFTLIKLFRSKDRAVFITCLTHLNIVSALSWMFGGRKNKLIVTEHNNYTQEKKDLSGIKRRVWDFLVKFTYRRVDKVIAVSGGVKQDLCHSLNIADEVIDVIYNPVDIEKIQHLAHNGTQHNRVTKTKQCFQIISMGRLVIQKRFDLLLEAFSILLQTYPQARLIILGEGKLKNDLENLSYSLGIHDFVSFQGFEANPFVIVEQADLFVLTSDFEGFGNVIVEALALGKQIVSTDCPSGPSEILDNGKYGFLVPCGQPEEIAKAMSTIISGKQIFTGQKERAKDFNVDVSYEKYRDIFWELTFDESATRNH